MAEKLIQTAVVIGVLTLAVGSFLPPLIDSSNTDAVDRVAIQEGEFVNLTDILRVTAQNVKESQNEVTVRYRNERTFERVDVLLNETDPPENKTVSLSGENITATLIEIDDNSTAIVETKHDRTFGWQSGPETFVNNFEIILVIIAALIIFGLVAVVLR